jgi:hypothetical protein
LDVDSSSEVVGGLQVAIKGMRRDGDKLYLTYAFRWVEEERSFVFLHDWGVIELFFWGSDGQMIEPTLSERYWVGDDFAEGKAEVFEQTTSVDLPAGAKFVAFTIASGLVTSRVAIPDRRSP